MPPLTTIKDPVKKNMPLDLKVNHADSLAKQENAELKKEVTRLQKLLAKSEIKHFSEIAKYKAKLAEERKNKINIIIDRADANL